MQPSEPSDVVRQPSEHENRYQQDLSVRTLASEKILGALEVFFALKIESRFLRQ